MRKLIFATILTVFLLPSLFIPGRVLAQDDGFTGFGVSPGLVEEWFNPGESKTKTLYVKNNLGKKATFIIELEDFDASTDPKIGTRLLGEKTGDYTLKDYLVPEAKEITVEDGQTATLKVAINIPKNVRTQGLYGSVLIKQKIEEKPAEMTKIYPRVGSLFYVGIEGSSIKNSGLEYFKYYSPLDCSDRDCSEEEKMSKFVLSYHNGDNVHASLTGSIEIKNIFGKVVDRIGVGPWFVMPNSTKIKELKWKGIGSMLGLYTANLQLTDSHSNKVIKKRVFIWSMPWQPIVVILFLTILIFVMVKLFEKHFRVIRIDEQKRKLKKKKRFNFFKKRK